MDLPLIWFILLGILLAGMRCWTGLTWGWASCIRLPE